jgi:hypothetical protein
MQSGIAPSLLQPAVIVPPQNSDRRRRKSRRLDLSRIEDLRELRMRHRLHDEELWDFVARVQGNNLINISEGALRWRLTEIERNILFLDSRDTPRDDLGPERGWLSPWWWWRMRHWTLTEFNRRELAPAASVEIPTPASLRPEFQGVFAGGSQLLVRISRRDRILDTLASGRLCFMPANIYKDAKLGVARADEEMAKSYHRPGSSLAITGPRSEPITPIGDVTFTTRRAVEQGSDLDRPYWMCSFSSDLDPRLFTEFADRNGAESACVVVFDPMEFVKRALPKLNQAVPFSKKCLFPIKYFDPHHPPLKPLSAVRHKQFSYAYQREMRFLIDPEGNPWSASASDEPFFVEVDSIEDIAAAYEPTGGRISGTGPDRFLA